MPEQTISEALRVAWKLHKNDAERAFDIFDSWCSEGMRRGVPGMGTTERLALRIYQGRSIEEAAAREYVYRWSLAIKAPDQCIPAGNDWRDRNPRGCVSVFGCPHTIGM